MIVLRTKTQFLTSSFLIKYMWLLTKVLVSVKYLSQKVRRNSTSPYRGTIGNGLPATVVKSLWIDLFWGHGFNIVDALSRYVGMNQESRQHMPMGVSSYTNTTSVIRVNGRYHQ